MKDNLSLEALVRKNWKTSSPTTRKFLEDLVDRKLIDDIVRPFNLTLASFNTNKKRKLDDVLKQLSSPNPKYNCFFSSKNPTYFPLKSMYVISTYTEDLVNMNKHQLDIIKTVTAKSIGLRQPKLKQFKKFYDAIFESTKALSNIGDKSHYELIKNLADSEHASWSITYLPKFSEALKNCILQLGTNATKDQRDFVAYYIQKKSVDWVITNGPDFFQEYVAGANIEQLEAIKLTTNVFKKNQKDMPRMYSILNDDYKGLIDDLKEIEYIAKKFPDTYPKMKKSTVQETSAIIQENEKLKGIMQFVDNQHRTHDESLIEKIGKYYEDVRDRKSNAFEDITNEKITKSQYKRMQRVKEFELKNIKDSYRNELTSIKGVVINLLHTIKDIPKSDEEISDFIQYLNNVSEKTFMPHKMVKIATEIFTKYSHTVFKEYTEIVKRLVTSYHSHKEHGILQNQFSNMTKDSLESVIDKITHRGLKRQIEEYQENIILEEIIDPTKEKEAVGVLLKALRYPYSFHEKRILDKNMTKHIKEWTKYEQFNYCDLGPGDGLKTYSIIRHALNSNSFNKINLGLIDINAEMNHTAKRNIITEILLKVEDETIHFGRREYVLRRTRKRSNREEHFELIKKTKKGDKFVGNIVKKYFKLESIDKGQYEEYEYNLDSNIEQLFNTRKTITIKKNRKSHSIDFHCIKADLTKKEEIKKIKGSHSFFQNSEPTLYSFLGTTFCNFHPDTISRTMHELMDKNDKILLGLYMNYSGIESDAKKYYMSEHNVKQIEKRLGAWGVKDFSNFEHYATVISDVATGSGTKGKYQLDHVANIVIRTKYTGEEPLALPKKQYIFRNQRYDIITSTKYRIDQVKTILKSHGFQISSVNNKKLAKVTKNPPVAIFYLGKSHMADN